MENKKIVPNWLSVIYLVLILASTFRSVIYIPEGVSKGLGAPFVVIKLLECLAYVASLLYCFTGYKKDSAKYFKLFCGAYALFALSTIYGKIVYINGSASSYVSVVLAVVIFVALCVLCFKLNLGWKKSQILADIIFACELANVFLGLNNDLSYILTLVGRAILASLLAIMVFAKYRDKKSRGTN